MVYGFTRHARLKMRRLGVRADEVIAVIEAADVIERYRERDGALLHGWARGIELHVSLVRQGGAAVTLVTTVYAVDRDVFPDSRTRRNSP